jgi:hypothetical protein
LDESGTVITVSTAAAFSLSQNNNYNIQAMSWDPEVEMIREICYIGQEDGSTFDADAFTCEPTCSGSIDDFTPGPVAGVTSVCPADLSYSTLYLEDAIPTYGSFPTGFSMDGDFTLEATYSAPLVGTHYFHTYVSIDGYMSNFYAESVVIIFTTNSEPYFVDGVGT